MVTNISMNLSHHHIILKICTTVPTVVVLNLTEPIIQQQTKEQKCVRLTQRQI